MFFRNEKISKKKWSCEDCKQSIYDIHASNISSSKSIHIFYKIKIWPVPILFCCGKHIHMLRSSSYNNLTNNKKDNLKNEIFIQSSLKFWINLSAICCLHDENRDRFVDWDFGYFNYILPLRWAMDNNVLYFYASNFWNWCLILSSYFFRWN